MNIGVTVVKRAGTDFGPCKDKNCGHEPCKKLRAWKKERCAGCGKRIGVEKPFQSNSEGRLVHIKCM